jgi:DNA-binding CsgD family transcriptional regulator
MAAELTRWAIERKEALMQNQLTVAEIMEAFEKDTGYKTTYYSTKQIFETLEIPVGRRYRGPSAKNNTRLDRLVKEVFSLSEQLCALVGGLREHGVLSPEFNPEDYATTPELTALRRRKAAPRIQIGSTTDGRTIEMNAEVRLTQRENEILQHVGLGLSNEEVANKLGIAVDMVKDHLSNVFRKIGVSDRVLAASLVDNGIELAEKAINSPQFDEAGHSGDESRTEPQRFVEDN